MQPYREINWLRRFFEFTGNILGEALADAIAFSSSGSYYPVWRFGQIRVITSMKPIHEKPWMNNVLNIYKGKAKLLMPELKDSDAAVLGASALGMGTERLERLNALLK